MVLEYRGGHASGFLDILIAQSALKLPVHASVSMPAKIQAWRAENRIGTCFGYVPFGAMATKSTKGRADQIELLPPGSSKIKSETSEGRTTVLQSYFTKMAYMNIIAYTRGDVPLIHT